MSFLSVCRLPAKDSPTVFMNVYTCQGGFNLSPIIKNITNNKFFCHIDVMIAKEPDLVDLKWYWLRIVFERVPLDVDISSIEKTSLDSIAPMIGVPPQYDLFKTEPSVHYRHGGLESVESSLSDAELQQLRKVLRFSNVRNYAEMDCHTHFNTNRDTSRGLPPISILRTAAEQYGCRGGSWIIFPARSQQNGNLEADIARRKHESQIYFEILLDSFLNYRLSKMSYVRSVSMDVHGNQTVVRVNNEKSIYLDAFNGWKDVDDDSEKALYKQDIEVFNVHEELKKLYGEYKVYFKYKLDVVSLGGFHNEPGTARPMVVAIYNSIDSPRNFSSRNANGRRTPTSRQPSGNAFGNSHALPPRRNHEFGVSQTQQQLANTTSDSSPSADSNSAVSSFFITPSSGGFDPQRRYFNN